MFETAELGQSVAKSEFRKRELELWPELLEVQRQVREYDKFPGVSRRGKVHLSLKHSFVKVGSCSGSYCPP